MVYNNGAALTQGVYVWGNGKWNTVAPAAGTVGEGGTSVVGLDGHKYFITERIYEYTPPYTCPPASSPATVVQVLNNVPAPLLGAATGWEGARLNEPEGIWLILENTGEFDVDYIIIRRATDYTQPLRGVCRED
jgi:hypothetical protein